MCAECEINLPQTNYHTWVKNPLFKIFTSIPNLNSAQAFLKYERISIARRILHAVKYEKLPEIGWWLAKKYGTFLIKKLQNADFIVPVPAHVKKLSDRGYNQAVYIAAGLSEATGIPVLDKVVIKKKETISQTKRSRVDRWLNMNEVFELKDEQMMISGKHLVIVDDVITTGATISNMSHALKDASEISIVAIATGVGYS